MPGWGGGDVSALFDWEAHDEACSAAVERWLERDRAVVALRHRLDDAQAEPARARAVAVGAEEALEDLVVELGRDARAVVLDREHDVAVAALDARLHRRARIGVAERVLHQVQDEPAELVLHAEDLGPGRGRDRDLVIAGDGLEL